jgi:sporulation protein YlmC with PRC-barrel domain
MTAYRQLDGGRELLDHQLIDRDGMLCGNVDDLELELPDDGGLLIVTSVLSGPGVLSNRIGGRLATGLGELHRRLHPTLDGAARIPWSDVREIDSAVHLSVARTELDGHAFEAWCADHIVDRIPGDRHVPAPE